jgi:tRNA pseudouridine55 synthase
MKSGFLVLDKESGFTSHDVVAIARKALGERRVGHAGTLDPFATGVLVLGVGIGTRLLPYITDGRKKYWGTIRLGSATTTDDLTGEVVSENLEVLKNISEEAIREELGKQVGEIYQRPSSYSAIKVGGKRAYELARAGEEVQLKERHISIYSLEIMEMVRHEQGIDVKITVACSAGTFIRSIARDLGAVLKVGGHLIALRREEVAPFSLIDAVSIEQVKSAPRLLSVDDVISRIFHRRDLTLEEVASVSHGRAIELGDERSAKCAGFTPDGEFIALLAEKGGRAQPIVVVSTLTS